MLLISSVYGADKEKWYKFTGSAFLDNSSYKVLERICYEAGGRLAGSETNDKAMTILEEELKKLGLNPRRESFTMPGWLRGEDKVIMTAPSNYEIRAAALGYVNQTSEINSGLIYVGNGKEEDYNGLDVNDKIILANQGYSSNGRQFLRCEAIDVAASKGAAAILFINEKNGGLLMAGVANFIGEPSPIPAYTITMEDGLRMKRLLEMKTEVSLKIITNSRCSGKISEENLVVTFPGKSNKKIVAGVHFDSWDLSQGAVDNGHGTAIAFETARLIQQFSRENNLTVEIVWFNAEELGLWGSKAYVEQHKSEDIAVMVNLDMTGIPTGFNAMGFDEFKPFLDNLCKELNGFDMKDGVSSVPYTNSDHMYFILEGIPAFTIHAHLEKDMYWYYHDFGDTFDKVEKKYFSEAGAVLSILLSELANDKSLEFKRMAKEQLKNMLLKHKIDETLKSEKLWMWE